MLAVGYDSCAPRVLRALLFSRKGQEPSVVGDLVRDSFSGHPAVQIQLVPILSLEAVPRVIGFTKRQYSCCDQTLWAPQLEQLFCSVEDSGWSYVWD